MNRPILTSRRSPGFTLVEMLMALAIFGIATLGIWECIRTVFFLSAKNTGLNLSHSALELGVDRMADQLRESMQVVDVASFDGTTFTHINEATASGTTASGNAVRFLRRIPVTLFLLPDDGKTYAMATPESPRDLQNPDDYLSAGNKTVKATYTTTASLTDPNFLADLNAARLLPRFPYLTEAVTSGSNLGTMPGFALAGLPSISGTNLATMTLTYGLPTTAKTVPSCNQAYLCIVSAVAILNRTPGYAEMIYYPDATNFSRQTSLTQALAPSTSGSGPAAFALPVSAGALNDPTARGSLLVTLPVYAFNLNNSVVRRGGTSALVNIELNLPVETRRRAQF